MTMKNSQSFSNHQLENGYIQILQMLDPFTYLAQCQECISLLEMNTKLKKIIHQCSSSGIESFASMKNSMVVVEDLDQVYYRGYINHIEEPEIYHISRIDVGDEICIQEPQIYYLPDNLLNLGAQRHTVKLHGIVPNNSVSTECLDGCNEFLKKLIFNAHNSKLNKSYFIDGYYYGIIEIETQVGCVCLNDVLLEENVALPSLNLKDSELEGKVKKKDATIKHHCGEKIAKSVGNIEITPQHKEHLSDLICGLLLDPEFYFESESNCSKMNEEKKVDLYEKKDQISSVKESLNLSGMGHGRMNAVLHSPGFSGGRGKIKELLRSPKVTQNSSDSIVKSPDAVQLNAAKPSSFTDDNCNSTNEGSPWNNFLSYIKQKEGSPYEVNSEKEESPNKKVNTDIHSEQSNSSLDEQKCFGKKSPCSSSDTNEKSKTPISKRKHFRDHKKKEKVRNIQISNENYRKTRNLDQLETSNQVTKPVVSPACPQSSENDPSDFKCVQTESPSQMRLNSEDMNDKKNQSVECAPEISCKSPDQVIRSGSNSSVYNSPPKSGSDNISELTVVKTFGRGSLIRKFLTSSSTSNIDEPSSSTSSIDESSLNNKLDVSPRLDVIRELTSEDCEPNLKENEKTNPDLQETNDEHEDRYFDIEEPEYLDSSKQFKDINRESRTNKDQDNCGDEDLSSLKNDTDLKPSDSEIVNPIQPETESEHLELQILRDYSVGQMTERMKMSCGLVHGNFVGYPATKLSELKLQQHILSNLNAKNMRELFRSQMFAVPVLLERKNLILVGPPNSGKTLACVMSVLSLLHDNEFYSTLKRGNGPRCVFVSSCAQNVNYISQFCSAICGAKLTIITTHGGGLELERKEELTNGCEILVTTPRCWLRLLKHNTVTNLFRVCHIIFDDTDILLQTFLPEIKEIMTQAQTMLLVRKRYCGLGIQIVLVGEKWTPVLEDITFNALEAPVLCITAHLEAALYARIKPKTYILPPDQKINKLKELLTFTSMKIRTVVVCKCADEVKLLRPLLEPMLSDVLVAHEEMNLGRLIEVSDQWVRRTSPPLLLCSDLILTELAVTNAQWLIHFSLPENKTSFSERFSTIKEHLYDRIKYPKTAPPDCQVHILIDDSNELQFPEIMNFMERLKTPIPKLFSEAVKKICVLKEQKKSNTSLCGNILMFGRCWKMDKCKKRHIFNKSRDHSGDLPIRGNMKVKFLYAHNPSHYSVRVLATKDTSDEEWTEFPSNYTLIGIKMCNHYSSRENRFPHGRVKIKDMVAIEVEPDLLFRRAEVIDIIIRDDKYNPELVLVHFIDEGYIDKYTAAQLLHLPPELQIDHPEAYDLYLMGIQPVDCDHAWSFASTLKIQKSISQLNLSECDNIFFIANVVLVAGKNLLASSFLCYEWLDLSKCHIVHFSPRQFILDTCLAEPNPAHFTLLMKLALEAGLISEMPEDLMNGDGLEKENIQWAHLDKDSANVVHVISSTSPSLFYLKIFKFTDRLENLEKELTKLLDTKQKKIEVIESNMLCAAKNAEVNKWNRALVNDVVNSNEVEVFFVDYGDRFVVPISDICHLPRGFIERLPFQAIECSLIGVLPLDMDWHPQAIEVFDNMCLDDENKLRSVIAKVCDATSASSTTARHYKVILAYHCNGKDIFINKELVYKGYANWDPETKHHLTENIVWPEVADCVDNNCDENEQWTDEAVNVKECIEMDKTSSATPGTFDLASVLANGEFELENLEHVLDLFPPEIQYKLKSKNIGSALKQYSEANPFEYKKDDSQISEEIREKNNSNNEGEKSDVTSKTFNPVPPLETCGLFHPNVYWSQKEDCVRIKVLLPSVSKYQVDYSDQTLTFSAFLDGRYYWFHVVLFGPICKKNVEYSSKGLNFEIRMEKFIKGEFWPRLTYDDLKFPWIKLDPDCILQDENTLIESMFNKGLRSEQFSHGNILSSDDVGQPDVDSDLESIYSSSDNEYDDLSHSNYDCDLD